MLVKRVSCFPPERETARGEIKKAVLFFGTRESCRPDLFKMNCITQECKQKRKGEISSEAI